MKIDKCSKLFCTLYDKENYVIFIRALKQALNDGLVLKKVHRNMLHVDINTKLHTEDKNGFEKDFFKLMNNSVFGKKM